MKIQAWVLEFVVVVQRHFTFTGLPSRRMIVGQKRKGVEKKKKELDSLCVCVFRKKDGQGFEKKKKKKKKTV